MKNKLTIISATLLAIVPLSIAFVGEMKERNISSTQKSLEQATTPTKNSAAPDFFRRGCLMELQAMRHFLKESTAYKQGTFPQLSSNFSPQQISAMIGRPLTEAEEERALDFSDLSMTLEISPELVGQPVSTASATDRIVVTSSGVAPNGLTGYITGNLDIEFEIGNPGSMPPVPPK